MDTWNSTRFIDNVSQKIGTTPSQSSGAEWGDVKAIQWSHPAHETSTKALDEHFLAVIVNPVADVSWRVNGGPSEGVSMPSGALTYVPAGRPVDWVIRRPMTVVNFFLPGPLLKAAAEGAGKNYGDLLSGREWLGLEDAHLARLTSIAADELINGSPGGKLYIDSILAALCSRLVAVQQSCEFVPRAQQARRVALTSYQVSTVKEFMRANLDREIGLRDISSSIGLSEFHFARSFKKHTGISPYKFFTNMRVEQARNLLRQSSVPIPEIAAAVGMWSQSHLTHVFKRVTGVTPAEYRRQSLSERSGLRQSRGGPQS